MLRACAFTVCSDRYSLAAISWLVSPSAMRASTSSSRALSGSARRIPAAARRRRGGPSRFIDGERRQQPPNVVRTNPSGQRLAEQASHRRTFVDEDADEAARLGQRQRFVQQLHGPGPLAMGIEGDGQQDEGLELLVRPGLLRHPPAIWLQHRERCGGISLGEVHPGLAEGKIVRLGHVRGRRHVALLQQRQHLGSSDLGHASTKPFWRTDCSVSASMAAAPATSLRASFRRASEHFTDDGSVDRADILPRQLEALLPVLFSGIQVVPFIEHASQAKVDFSIRREMADRPPVAGASVGFGRLIELVVRFLHIAQAG